MDIAHILLWDRRLAQRLWAHHIIDLELMNPFYHYLKYNDPVVQRTQDGRSVCVHTIINRMMRNKAKYWLMAAYSALTGLYSIKDV